MTTPTTEGELESLLAYIHDRRNFDFRGYKRPSLERRIAKRMQAVGAEDYQRYIDVLEANPGEFGELFNTILINVTSLMRDREAWEYLAEFVLPSMIDEKGPTETIRVWSAGCASGEEPYTLAVLFAEAMGEERFRRQVKIYATDADADALVEARHGRYKERDLVAAFGTERAQRFFEIDQGYGTFRPDLRRSLIFGQHDLVQDAPISKIDLLACRNTLMYFTSEVQRQVLATFHFALNPNGVLFLGKSEALVARIGLFTPIDLRRRLFVKDGARDPLVTTHVIAPRVSFRAPQEGHLADSIVELSPTAQLVVDQTQLISYANREARRMFGIGSVEAGAPLHDVELIFRTVDLRTIVEQSLHDRRIVTLTDVSSAIDGSAYDIAATPLDDHRGVVMTFTDVTRYRALRSDLERSQRELESAYEELQSAVEELETTNEELQSTNEELETTNEELHSTNEELETMNEELQSTNEELESINNELRERIEEVENLNHFLNSILASLRSAVVVIDTDMAVRAWNSQAEELWGLRADEVQSQHFLSLDFGFPVEALGAAIRAVLAGRSSGDQVAQKAINRRGRSVECVVTVSPLIGGDQIRGVILLMDATQLVDDEPGHSA